jgi:hypothetical protein
VNCLALQTDSDSFTLKRNAIVLDILLNYKRVSALQEVELNKLEGMPRSQPDYRNSYRSAKNYVAQVAVWLN